MKLEKYLKLSLKNNNKKYIVSLIMLILSITFILISYQTTKLLLIFSVIFISISLVYLVLAIKKSKLIKGLYNSYQSDTIKELEKEIKNNTIYVDENNQTIYTKNYIFNYNDTFDIFKYKDVIWLFPYIIRHNGNEKEWNLTLITEDRKKHVLVNIDDFEKTNDGKYNDLTNYIHNINEEMVIGYTKENIEIIKELYNYENGN